MPYILAAALGALTWVGVSGGVENVADRVLPPAKGISTGTVVLFGAATVALFFAHKKGLI